MHQNPIYHVGTSEEWTAFAAKVGFGMLAVSVPDAAPLISHVPFTLCAPDVIEMHLMRSNPVARAVTGDVPARMAVQGPHGYISPDWYGIDDQVPTWNYIAVHLTGRLEPRPQEELLAGLDRLSDTFEERLLPKPVWKSDKMDQDKLQRMMRMVQPFHLHVETVEGTWKLAQNKDTEVALRAAEGLAESDIGSDTGLLAEMMREAKRK